MAKITRPNIDFPIFGNGAAADELTIFGTSTQSTDITLLLTNANSEDGWASGVDANGFPALSWFNAIGHTLSYITAYYLQNGIPEWVLLQEYFIGSKAVASDGFTYVSKTDNNTGNTPVGDSTNWRLAFLDSANTVVYTPTDNYHPATKKYVDDAVATVSAPATGIRQTVQSASVAANGLPDYISIGTGLAVDIAATTIPVTIHASNKVISDDRFGTLSADTSLSGLTDATTNYLYADVAANGSITLGATTLAPVYQFGGTYSITSGQATFNISEMTMKVGNGASADQTYRVFIGEAVTAGGVVTSVVNYGLNGLYDSGYTNTLPGINTNTSKNHNIGVIPLERVFLAKCLTTDLGYTVGEEINPWTGSSVQGAVPVMQSSDKTISLQTGNSNAFLANTIGSGVLAVLTLANWQYRFIIKRGW